MTPSVCRLGGIFGSLILLASIALSGCSTSSVDDFAPSAAPAATDADVWPDAPAVASAKNTGTFPNLNEVPTAANRQLAPEERDAKLAELEAAREGQRPPGSRETEEQRRKRLKLLADRQADTLKVIESN